MILKKFQKWWLFHMRNGVIRRGKAGAFKWTFRKYYLEISTLSGNFEVKFTAGEHPYGYLLMGDDSQTQGFAERLYMIGTLMTTEQEFVDALDKALGDYHKRLERQAVVEEDETEEKIALEEAKQVQEYVEASPKEKRKMERDANGRFKKVAQKLQAEE